MRREWVCLHNVASHQRWQRYMQEIHGPLHCATQRQWNIVLGQYLEKQRYTDLLAAELLMRDGPCDPSELNNHELNHLVRHMWEHVRGSTRAPFALGLDNLRSVQGDIILWPEAVLDNEAAADDEDGPGGTLRTCLL
jgi:hypothetical protein